jgi:hypothetical protein
MSLPQIPIPVHAVEALEKVTRFIGMPILCFTIFKDRFRQVAPVVVPEIFYLSVGYD